MNSITLPRSVAKAQNLLLLIFILCFSSESFTQTPGLIVRKGNVLGELPSISPLDPNGDGWTSTTTAGFLGNDITNIEIAYQVEPNPFNGDPEGDLRRGPTGGFSEILSGPYDSGFFFFQMEQTFCFV
jgi:hypothetical protein